jgi:putative spermidine/putrescine transport system substrate-binding protein
MTRRHDRRSLDAHRLSRRAVLKGVGIGAGLAAAGVLPALRSRARAATAGKVIVRTGGGAYENALRKAIFEPFTAATGIEVQSFATNVAKIAAMVEAHDVQVDVADLGAFTTVTFEKRGALEKIDRSKFKRTDLADIDSVTDYYIGENTYGTVMGYNTTAFGSNHPHNWAEFWDVKRFPGRRMLEDISAEFPNLEFALLADGVPMDKLYPLDIDRAFKKLREIRPHITKWWTSGAVSAQMLASKDVVLGSVWNGRILALMDKKAPLAIEWTQSSRQLQTLCILKGAPNLENALAYIDFALQPKPQAEVAKLVGYGPTNRKAFQFIDAKLAARLPTSPEHLKIGFTTNERWWVDHRAEVSSKWQAFLLGE